MSYDRGQVDKFQDEASAAFGHALNPSTASDGSLEFRNPLDNKVVASVAADQDIDRSSIVWGDGVEATPDFDITREVGFKPWAAYANTTESEHVETPEVEAAEAPAEEAAETPAEEVAEDGKWDAADEDGFKEVVPEDEGAGKTPTE